MTELCGERWLETGSPFDVEKNNMNESFYMHPRYNEFTAFLKTLNTDAKITPSTKHLAFDVWLKMVDANDKLKRSNALLVQTLNEVSE